MTKLLLKSADPAHDVSIRLLPGQFCTLGSSSAADYCVRAAGILPMHCRIGCRQNGGFIECFDDSATINIAGSHKNRSRLTNGDLLKIGVVRIQVVIPQASQPATAFDNIAFDDIESTESADIPIATQPEVDLFDEAIDPLAEQEQPEAEVSTPTSAAPASSDRSPTNQPEPQTPSRRFKSDSRTNGCRCEISPLRKT